MPDTHTQDQKQGCQTPINIFLDAFAKAFEKAVTNNPKISHWELLNEMNYKKYFDGGENPWETYQILLEKVYPIAKKYQKTLVTGGIAFEGEWQKWLEHLTSKSCSRFYDILAVHPYCWPKDLKKTKFNGKKFGEVVSNIRADWLKNEVQKKPIWITEIGWPHHPKISKQEQQWGWITSAQFKQRKKSVIELCKELDIKRVFFYALEDDAWYEKGKNKLLFGFQDKYGKLK